MLLRTMLALAAAIGMSVSAAAQTAPRCGAPYAVSPGDSLSSIALRAYQDARLWRRIYEHGENAARIGPNPSALIVGLPLDLPPCAAGGVGVAPAAPLAPSGGGGAVAAAPQPRPVFAAAAGVQGAAGFVPTIELLSGGGFRPFIDKSQEGGGFLTEIVEAAFRQSGLPNDTRVDFVNDWNSHVEVLLRHNKYEFGFPWTKPNCTDPASLPEETRLRCEYVYSDPIYVIGIDVFGPKSLQPWPERPSDLFDKRLCRPQGRATDDLEALGLRHARNITLIRAASAADCFAMLERGDVDFVSDTRFTSELAMHEAGLSEFVTAYPGLVNAASVHVIAHRDNAEASVLFMRAFNQGLATIRQTGEWDAIVNSSLERFRASLR